MTTSISTARPDENWKLLLANLLLLLLFDPQSSIFLVRPRPVEVVRDGNGIHG